MTVGLLRNLSLLAYILAGVMSVVSIFLFWILKIPNIIQELTGSDARKTIENIQRRNEEGQEINSNVSGSLIKQKERSKSKNKHSNAGILNNSFGTAKIGTYRLKTEKSFGEETTVLTGDNNVQDTSVLDSVSSISETTVLEGDNEYMSYREMNVQSGQRGLDNTVTVGFDITFIHIEEWIE